MCGITGYRSFDTDRSRLPQDLAAANRSLLHRGPDDGGHWVSADGAVGFGHRRLAILDLSMFGHQPMVSDCGQWTMIFNGEVYNFRHIRAELEPLGHSFKGSGDSEVILAAFSQWGPDAVKRFLGMFAIALWHSKSGDLHLIRDRLGVKPLYYHWNGKLFAFASELKAIRAFGQWKPEIDRDAMMDFFRHGYIGAPKTIYRDVYKLPAAHRVVLKADGSLEKHCYWSIQGRPELRHSRTEDEVAEELEALMISAFQYRMISDVPVGVFLSGGVDSSLVTALLQKSSDRQIRTFTIGFGEDGYDESGHAEGVARYLGTDHKTRRLSVDDAMHILPNWGDLYDEPFGDPTGIPSLLVSRMAAEEVKVVLSADGGDELFAGYDSYSSIIRRLQRLSRIPNPVRRMVDASLGLVPLSAVDEWLAHRGGSLSHRVRERVTWPAIAIQERIGLQPEGRHFDHAMRVFTDRELIRLLGREALQTREGCDSFDGEIGERMCRWDVEHYLAENCLTKVDRTTMAASIEGREPLLDHRLVEFAFSIPFEMKMGALGSKHLLRKILYKHVPRELVDRPKRGFSVPLEDWFSRGLRALPERYLERSRIREQGLLDPEMTTNLLARLRAGDPLAVNKVWLLLAFQMWHERWME